ncbi:hypothetical protein ACW7BJ_07255 [Azospirillum argentinense]|uniref:hypothetical protein n=1 Tax=Azospirillum argentinense TaxID=2970906 RepID=UPI001FFE53C0|nr:hypothetical protein [Azospirillum argentinense]
MPDDSRLTPTKRPMNKPMADDSNVIWSVVMAPRAKIGQYSSIMANCHSYPIADAPVHGLALSPT